jgi:hypothetical protein
MTRTDALSYAAFRARTSRLVYEADGVTWVPVSYSAPCREPEAQRVRDELAEAFDVLACRLRWKPQPPRLRS